MTLLRAGVGGLALAQALIFSATSPAAALSCVGFDDGESYSTFFGKVVERQGDRYRLEVEQVWRGEDVQRSTWITFADYGYPGDPEPVVGRSIAVHVDAAFQTGTCSISHDATPPADVRPPLHSGWWTALSLYLKRSFA